jgi:hypothetical protein
MFSVLSVMLFIFTFVYHCTRKVPVLSPCFDFISLFVKQRMGRSGKMYLRSIMGQQGIVLADPVPLL